MIKNYKFSTISKFNGSLSTISVLFDFIRESNKKEPGKNCYELLKEINEIFDLFDFNEDKIPKEIINLAKEREKCRKEKNWKKSDEIRELIRKKGYLMEDLKNSYNIKKSV